MPTKTLLLSVILAAASSYAAAAETPAPSAPLALLAETFGDTGVETLAARGLVVLQGKPGARRLAAVHWKALIALERAKTSCLALAAAADALGHEPEPSSPDLGLSACRALPDGLMTPSLHALAAALEAGHEERWALKSAGAPIAGAPGKENLFDTPWGKSLIERRHADVLENPAALVKQTFEDLLAGPRPDKNVSVIIAAEAAARGATSVETLMAYDGSHGALSEELRAQLRRTLSNERRRWAASKARSAASDLIAKAGVKKELDDLRGAAKALSGRPNLPAALEAAATRAAVPTGGAKLKSAGLHLQEPTRLGQHELGDEAIASGAYWVDGLKEKESLEIEETLVLETERGFASVETRSSKRPNGGPYTYSRSLKIGETRPFAIRALVSAAGSSTLGERVEVDIAQDFELALLKESEAAALKASCRPKDSEAAFLALETLVAEPAKVKPQYKALLERSAKAREASKRDGETLVKLEEALAASRAASAPQLCKYETRGVDEALKLAKLLPAGCDRDLPELHALRATIVRRAADQNWFLKASSDARSKRKSCDLNGARARWSEALAALDADPGARCGKAAEEEGKVKTEFAELTRKIAWREELGKALAKAEAETTPARRLEVLRPVTARLGALNGDCFGSESKRASTLTAAASKSLTAPADSDINRRLPPDAGLASVIADVKAERSRRLEAAGAAERTFIEQNAAPSAAPPAKEDDDAPAPAPSLKKKPAKRSTKETAR